MDVSVIIINFNTFELTCNCISSVYENTRGITFEIILVDNFSKELPAEKFKERFPEITLIALKENAGFGKANNLGMLVAKGKYFLLLNSDTIVLKDSIPGCFNFMESNEAKSRGVGLLGCKLLNPDLSHQPSVFPYLENNLWIYFITTNPIAFKILGLLKKDRHANFNASNIQEVGDVSGAYMFIRKEVAKASGYFDTDFFMYCEDTEWCRERISKIARIFFYPAAAIIHLGGQSAPQDLMYIQSKLSLSLLWYKKGWLNYAGYILLSYLNVATCMLLYPFIKTRAKDSTRQYISAYYHISRYLFNEVPKYSRKPNSRKKKLIFKKARTVLGYFE